MFFGGELRSSVRVSHGSENFDFRCCEMPIIVTSMHVFATSNATKMEHSILFVKIVNRYFERQQFFFGGTCSEV